MKKVLIYYPEWRIAPKGGAAGYLYNLQSGLRNLNDSEIQIDYYENYPVRIEDKKQLRDMIPQRLKEIRRAYKFSNYLKRKNIVDRNLYQYDAIHFHETEAIYLNREFLSEYDGKVFLTSHSPCAPHVEILNRINRHDYLYFKKGLDSLCFMDEYAFTRAEHIIFPCKEAEEPYINTWPEYNSVRKEEKMIYIPTGITKCRARIDRESIRRKYNIPKDAFLVCYVGRHNVIKGYEDLKMIGEKVLEDENVYFIIAGMEEPLKRLIHPRWIEVGWTNDPHSIISASDVFVLPNKETYFDLILLEVLSLGISMIVSETGGNKYFRRFSTESILEYKTIQECIDHICRLKALAKDSLEYLGKTNERIFDENFTSDIFAQKYIDALKTVLT